jgi:hypothetical protein
MEQWMLLHGVVDALCAGGAADVAAHPPDA